MYYFLQNELKNLKFSDVEEALKDLFGNFNVKEETPKVKEIIELELPGVKKEDIKIKTKGNLLIVDWKRRTGEPAARSYPIPDNTDIEKIGCTLKDGLLIINIPQKKAQPENSIDIKIN